MLQVCPPSFKCFYACCCSYLEIKNVVFFQSAGTTQLKDSYMQTDPDVVFYSHQKSMAEVKTSDNLILEFC